MAHISVSNHFKRFWFSGVTRTELPHKKKKKIQKEGRKIYAAVLLEIHAIMPKVRLNMRRMSGRNPFSFVIQSDVLLRRVARLSRGLAR